MPEKSTSSRREFLTRACGAGAALALPAFIPARALGRDGHTAPSNRIHVGALGLGFAWNMFPPPKLARMHMTENISDRTRPRGASPRSFSP